MSIYLQFSGKYSYLLRFSSIFIGICTMLFQFNYLFSSNHSWCIITDHFSKHTLFIHLTKHSRTSTQSRYIIYITHFYLFLLFVGNKFETLLPFLVSSQTTYMKIKFIVKSIRTFLMVNVYSSYIHKYVYSTLVGVYKM